MLTIPEGMRTDFDYKNADSAWRSCGHPQVLKPTMGSMGSLAAEFRVHEEYSAADSEIQGKEIKREVEIVLIRADKFSNIPKRIGRPGVPKTDENGKIVLDKNGRPIEVGKISSELSTEEQIKLATLYERFKNQRASGETDILSWEAINDGDRLHLAMSGVFTVEQLHNIPEHEQFKLGPGALEYKKLAARHIASKKEKDPNERAKEMALLLEEKEKLSRRIEEQEAAMFKMQEGLAALEKKNDPAPKNKGGRPKKVVLPGPMETKEAA